jgi:peptidoglycan/LPS O-acetylase OafA/YrhL
MSPVSPIPVFALLALALATVWALDRWSPLQQPTQRVATIDGLRGYLAFGVFLHHSCIWYFQLKTGNWEPPPSQLYEQLGQTSVALFFMTTAFLFTSKLADSSSGSLDWLRLYISRLTRIAPVWLLVSLFAAGVGALIVRLGLDANNPAHLANSAKHLLITAGVNWTLHYEWNFYFALPLLALLLRKRPPLTWLAAGCFLLLTNSGRLADVHAATFLGGIAAAVLARQAQFRAFACTRAGSACATGLLLCATSGFKTTNALWLLLLSGSFVLIASGADLFGLLTRRLSYMFGEITYSIYLLHGPLLFITFRFGLGFSTASALDPLQHWTAVACVTPLLITLCHLSFRFIEKPAVASTAALTARVRTISSRLRRS